MGLRTSRHINRIVIDPRDNDTVFVAATGPLFGPGGERGVFKTIDGGKTWKQVAESGRRHGRERPRRWIPPNNQMLYASTYQRRRTACCMNGGGPGSGIWKSTDGGETWTRLKTGIPEGPLGRIGLDVYRKRPNILYALIEGPAAGAAAAGGGGAAADAARRRRAGGRRRRPPRRRRQPRRRRTRPRDAESPRRPVSIVRTTPARRGGR